MRYRFRCDTTAKDCWILAMNRIYHSMVGVCSLIFAASVIALTAKFWAQSSTVQRGILLFACLLVPVIQPLGVWLRSVKQARQLPKDMELGFHDQGIRIRVGDETADLSWKKVARVVKERNMVILLTKDHRGYMLTDRALGGQKEDFYRYAASRIS